ncbi:MAG: NAD(P)H-hydrate dehydratase [Nitrososphaeria archaeon]
MISSNLYQKYLPKEITSEEMAAIEENSESIGFPRRFMMENAGALTADFISNKLAVKEKRVLIVCGTGNNGGDGFVIARHLRNFGATISLMLIGKPGEIRTDEARSNWSLIENMDEVKKTYIIDTSQINLFTKEIATADLIIDAMLGTGVRGKLREPMISVVNVINSSGKQVFAVDTPTGLDPSTGEVLGEAVKASYTITYHKMKRGLKAKPEYTGEIEVKQIGVPLEAEFFVGPGDVRRAIKPRKIYSHKGDNGYILVIGGSEVFSGAPALAALSALRTGAGLVHILAPASVSGSIRQMSPDLIVHHFQSNNLDSSALDLVEELTQKADTLVVGPGLGLDESTVNTVHKIIGKVNGRIPVVLDADGFKAAKSNLKILENTVATPHAGEFKYVFETPMEEEWWNRLDKAVEVAKEHRFTLILKGHDTIITDGKKAKVNRWNTPGLAVGGTGDVLSGILATLLAWKQDRFVSAVASTYIHGDAGKKAVAKKGFHILASDLIEEIPNAMKPFDVEEA